MGVVSLPGCGLGLNLDEVFWDWILEEVNADACLEEVFGIMDEKARRILFDTYWSSAGWKREYVTPPADFAYARAAGYMFDPLVLSHDDVMTWLDKAKARVRLEDVAGAFLASLTTRRLAVRSALGSYAVARHFPIHEYTPNFEGICTSCGMIRPPLAV